MGSPRVEAWNQEQKRKKRMTDGTTQDGSSVTSARVQAWDSKQSQRTLQSLHELNAGMQDLQKKTNARKSYWDGNDQHIRQQVDSLNRMIDSVEQNTKWYGNGNEDYLSALQQYRQYNKAVISALDADAQRFGKYESKDQYDSAVRQNYTREQNAAKARAEQQEKQRSREQNDPLNPYRQMTTEQLQQNLAALEAGQTNYVEQKFNPNNSRGMDWFKKSAVQNPTEKRNAQRLAPSPQSMEIGYIKTVLKEREQAEQAEQLKHLPPEAIKALDTIADALDAMDTSGVREDSGGGVQKEAARQIEWSKNTLARLGYENWEELADVRRRQRNAERAAQEQQAVQEATKEHPVLENAYSVIDQATRGVSGIVDLATVAAGGEIDVNDQFHAAGRNADTVRGTTQEMIDEKVDSKAGKIAARVAYNVGMGVADNFVRMGLGYAAGGAAYASTISGALMGSQVMSQAIVEGKQKGYSDGKAVGMALVQAAIEAATEKYSIETLLKDSKKVFLQVGKAMLAEGGEEVASNAANYIADALANGDESELNAAYDRYRMQGMSDKDALKTVIWDVVKENAEDFLVGGLSGAVLGAGSSVAFDQRRKAYGDLMIQSGAVNDLLDDAEGRKDKELQKYADKVKEKENPSARAVGNLVLRLDELGEDRKAIVEKYVSGKRLSEADRKAVRSDPQVKQMIEEQGVAPERRALQEGDLGYQALMSTAEYYKNTAAESSYVDNYRAGQNVDNYFAAHDAVYRMAADGYKFEDVEAMFKGEWTDDFTREQAIEAHRAGFREGMAAVSEPFAEVQVENNSTDVIQSAELKNGVTLVNVQKRLDATTRTQLAVLQNFGKEKGIAFAVVDDYARRYADINGAQLGGTNKIVINLDAEGGLLLRTAGHEVFHYIEQKNADAARKLREFVVDHYVKEGKYESLAQKYAQQGYKGDIESELTADNLFDVMTQEGFLQQYAGEDAATVRTLRNTVAAFIRHINNALKKLTLSNPIHKEIYDSLTKDKQFLEELRKKATEALDSLPNAESGTRTDAKRSEGKSSKTTNEKYSIKMSTNGERYVQVDEDAIDTSDGKSVAKTIAAIIANKFGNLIQANGQSVRINSITAKEYQRSRYSNILRIRNPEQYMDKLKSIANADEIVVAARGWIEENTKHGKFPHYGTANVFYKVGEKGYVARVVVGLKNDGSATLYDLVSIKDKKITEAPTKDKRMNLPSSVDASVIDSIPLGQAESQDKLSLKLVGTDESNTENDERTVMRRGAVYDFPGIRESLEKIEQKYNNRNLSNVGNAEAKVYNALKRLESVIEAEMQSVEDSREEDVLLTYRRKVRQMLRKVTSNGIDAKLSLKPASSISEEHRALIEENEKYKALIGKLNRQLYALQKKVVDPKGVRKLARDVRAEFQSKIGQTDLEEKLTTLFDYIANEQDIDFGEIMRVTAEIAKDVISQSDALNTELTEQYADLRDYLKTTKLQLTSLQKSEMAVQFDGYENFRRKNFGKIRFTKDGIKLDEVWNELCDRWPEFFRADEHEADMPLRLMDAIEATNPFHENPYGMNMDEAAYDLALRIYDAYYDIPEVGSMQRQINDLRAEYKEKYKKALQKTRTEYEGKLAEQVARLERKGLPETRRRAVSQVLQSANALAKKLAANSAKKNVPDVLKGPVMGLLDTISAYSESGRVTELNRSFFENLRKAHERLTDLYKDGSDDALESVYSENLDLTEDFMEQMRQLRRDVDELFSVYGKDNKHVLQMMTLPQLEAFNRVLVQMHHMVTKAGELYQNELYRNANDLARDTIRDLSAMKERSAHKYEALDKMETFLGWTNATPYYVFKRFGAAGLSIFNEMQTGWDNFAFRVRDVRDYALDTYTAKEAQEWEKDVRTFKDKNGQEFRLTIPQIMSIYCLSWRDAALRHLLGGGITPGQVGKYQQSQRYKLDEKTLDTIIGALSERQIEVADKLQSFLSTTCAEWGNAISMKRFGIRIFTEKFYFPMAVDQNTVSLGDTPKLGSGLFDLINRSFTKELNDKASNALYAQNIFDVFTAHATDMAQYNALALPVLDMMKWYNGTVAAEEQAGENEGTRKQNVRAELERVFGAQAKTYIDQFVRDINGSTSEDRSIGLSFMRNFKVAKVAANLNVALVQPTAYVRAGNVMDPKYLFSAMSGIKDIRKHIADMQQYSGIGLWKSMGFFDVDVNRSLSTIIKHGESAADKVREQAMKGAEVMDNVTWGLLFYACQKWAYKEKGLAFGSEACNKAAAEKFRDVVYSTQVVDSTMTRSALMRSKGTFDQITSAFMSEPTLSYNMVMDQFFNVQKDVQSGMTKRQALQKNGKTIARMVGVYCTTAIVTALAEAVTGALRDEDDDEYGEKYAKAFVDNLLGDLSLSQKIPVIKYFAEAAKAVLEKKSASYSNPTTQVFEEFTSTVNALRSGNVWEYRTVYKLLSFLSDATGLPMSSLTREVVAVWNTVIGETHPELKLRRYAEPSKKSKVLKIADGEHVESRIGNLLEDAIKVRLKQHPDESYEEAEKNAKSGLKTSITSAAHDVYDGGDTAKAKRLLQQSGLYDEEDVRKKLDEWSKE